MKNMLFCICILVHALNADISIIRSIGEVLDYIEPDKNTLVLFDLNDTLSHSEYDLMDKKTRNKLHKLFEQHNYDRQHFKLLLSGPIEPSMSTFTLKELHKQGVSTAVLTQNSKLTHAHVVYKLSQAHIKLSKKWRKMPRMKLQGPQSTIIFDHGVISCGKNTKGQALSIVLKTLNYTPEHIIFVDNNALLVRNVEEEVEKMGISQFQGLVYLHPQYSREKDFKNAIFAEISN